MNLFQILEVSNVVYNNSLSKVTVDICSVAEKYKFKTIRIVWNSSAKHRFEKFKKNLRYWWDWHKCYNEITDNSIVLLQHPLHVANSNVLKKLKSEKNVKYISVIIDIEELRKFYYNEFHKKEFELMLDIADVLIVHNNIMARYLIEKGVSEEKIVNIETFDYLQNNDNVIKFEKSITFAGNLRPDKCGFLTRTDEIPDVDWYLYGPKFDASAMKGAGIHYCGCMKPAELTQHLNKGFGLVWDGDELDTCAGEWGGYLKWNNPHKLSLYLASGLPVVTWDDAATASFIKENDVGITVASLKELPTVFSSITVERYRELCANARCVARKLREGYFLKAAVSVAMDKL